MYPNSHENTVVASELAAVAVALEGIAVAAVAGTEVEELVPMHLQKNQMLELGLIEMDSLQIRHREA
jgi:hypothetical protein